MQGIRFFVLLACGFTAVSAFAEMTPESLAAVSATGANVAPGAITASGAGGSVVTPQPTPPAPGQADAAPARRGPRPISLDTGAGRNPSYAGASAGAGDDAKPSSDTPKQPIFDSMYSNHRAP